MTDTATSRRAPTGPDPLITPDQLAAALAAPPVDQPPVVLDVRWSAGVVDRAAYLAGHVPGAVFLDLDADLAGPPGPGGRHPLPDPEDLQEVWRRVGVDDDSSVVVYDSRDSSIAARVWWLLRWSGLERVRVLDGGFAGWAGGGRPVQHGEPPTRPAGSVTVRPGGMPVVDTGRAAALAGGAGTLLDARATARFRGESEPLDPVAGHIPGAVNLPLTELVTSEGRFRPHAELRRILDAVAPLDPVAASCGSGVTACHLILAGALVGRTLALYPDSYSGWLAQGRAVAIGAEPGAPRT